MTDVIGYPCCSILISMTEKILNPELNQMSATAIAHPNIAFIKYWGNRDEGLHLPLNGSLSMCLDGLTSTTTVRFDPSLKADELRLDSLPADEISLARVSSFLNNIRGLAGKNLYAQVESVNNFPAGAGIASSASGFAALALAASAAIGLSLSEQELSRLARLGSGSACRSIPGGFVAWLPGSTDLDSYAVSIAPPEHWQLFDLVTILDRGHKSTGSASGMALAHTSPRLGQRLAELPARLAACKQALLACDFEAFAELVEADSQSMHAVMQTSTPALKYTLPLTELILASVTSWRKQGYAACATVDAGPNVHVLCLPEAKSFMLQALHAIPGVLEVLVSQPGGPARLV